MKESINKHRYEVGVSKKELFSNKERIFAGQNYREHHN